MPSTTRDEEDVCVHQKDLIPVMSCKLSQENSKPSKWCGKEPFLLALSGKEPFLLALLALLLRALSRVAAQNRHAGLPRRGLVRPDSRRAGQVY